MTTANASNSPNMRTRVQAVPLLANAAQFITANFGPVLPPGVTLLTALWESDWQDVAGLSNGEIGSTSTTVKVNCPREGWTYVRCEVTTTAGTTLNQYFRVDVSGGAFVPGTPAGSKTLLLVMPGG